MYSKCTGLLSKLWPQLGQRREAEVWRSLLSFSSVSSEVQQLLTMDPECPQFMMAVLKRGYIIRGQLLDRLHLVSVAQSQET